MKKTPLFWLFGRALLLGCVVLLFVGGTVLAWRGFQKEPVPVEPERPVKVEAVSFFQDAQTFKYYGTLEGSRQVSLSFRVYGPLVELPVSEGDAVKKGQLLARLDERDYRTKVENATAGLSVASARLAQAKNDFQRASALRKSGAIAQAAFEQAQTAYRLASSGVESSKAQLAAAQDALRDTRLEAPFDGVIARRLVDNFQDVQASQPIVELQTVGDLDIKINVPDLDMVRFPGIDFLTGEASFDAAPGKSFPLKFKDMGTKADPMTRTYPVTVSLTEAPQGVFLLPGMPVTVTVSTKPKAGDEKVFSVSSNSLASPDGRTVVWVIKDGQAQKREVKVTRYVNGRALVTGNLAVGERIAVAGVSFLHEGQKVRTLEGE